MSEHPDSSLSIWKGSIPRDPKPLGGMGGLMSTVAAEYGLETSDFFSSSRKRYLAHARQDFMWRCRQVKWQTGAWRYSLPQIGMFLGGMNHTSILHGVREHEKRRLKFR